MGDGFLDSLKEDNDFFNQTVAIGVMDQDGNICASWYPTSFSVGDDTEELLRQYSREEKSGVVVRSEKVPDGMLSLYKQERVLRVYHCTEPGTQPGHGTDFVCVAGYLPVSHSLCGNA